MGPFPGRISTELGSSCAEYSSGACVWAFFDLDCHCHVMTAPFCHKHQSSLAFDSPELWVFLTLGRGWSPCCQLKMGLFHSFVSLHECLSLPLHLPTARLTERSEAESCPFCLFDTNLSLLSTSRSKAVLGEFCNSMSPGSLDYRSWHLDAPAYGPRQRVAQPGSPCHCSYLSSSSTQTFPSILKNVAF